MRIGDITTAAVSQKLFRAAAMALWGSQYQTEAARALGISLSSVVRYGNGERVAPRAVFEALSELLDDHMAQIRDLKPTVRNAMEMGDA